MEKILKLVLALVFGVFAAYVTLDIYTWFVLPLGAPKLSLAHVYGLLLFKALLFYQYDNKDPDLLQGLALCLVVWGLGAVAVQFL